MKFYDHPNPRWNRVRHFGAFILVILIWLTIPLQLWIAVRTPAPLFVMTAMLTLFMSLPLIWLLSASPRIEIQQNGIEIQPVVWRKRLIPWADILAIKTYPLLPQSDQEVIRRFMTGKKKYRPAEGKMLIVQNMPIQYRVTGFFAGERPRAVIAITNRSHVDYMRLVNTIQKQVKTSLAPSPDLPHEVGNGVR